MEVELPRNIDIIKSAELDDYFVFYAFNRSDHLYLYITDKSLKLIEEIEVNESGYFSSEFHQTECNQLLFSTTLTGTTFENKLPKTNAYYQYFETKWYKLKITSKGLLRKSPVIELNEYQRWDRSEIKNIKSRKIGDKIFWLSDIQNIRIEEGRYKKSWSFQYATTRTFDELPEFKRIDIRYSGVKAIDFHVEHDTIYVAAICDITWDKAVVFAFQIQTNQIQKEELQFNIRKLHHLHDVKLVNHDDKLISYFNSTSHEHSKKYEFRIYKSITPKNLIKESEISFLNKLDYIRNVKWYEDEDNLYTSYASNKESKTIRISKVLFDGEKLVDEFEDISTIMITKSNELIYSYVKGVPLKKTYLVKQKIKNYD